MFKFCRNLQPAYRNSLNRHEYEQIDRNSESKGIYFLKTFFQTKYKLMILRWFISLSYIYLN